MISQAIQVVNLTTGSNSETYAIELMAADYLAGVGVEVDTCEEPSVKDAAPKAA